MDLREKPGMIQRLGEMILRFRLIFVVVLACVCGYLFAGYTDILTFALAMSEALGIKVATFDFVAFLPWLLLPLFLLLPRFLACGKQAGFTSLVLCALMPAGFFALQNAEFLALPVMVSLALLSFILFVFVKHGYGCAAFPAFLSAIGFIGAIDGLNIGVFSRHEIAVFVTLLVCDIFTFAVIAGQKLAAGEPKNGALLWSLRKNFLPLVLTPVLCAILFAVKGGCTEPRTFVAHLALSLGYIVFALFLSFPLLTFAPFARLRASKREMNVPKSTGVKKK